MSIPALDGVTSAKTGFIETDTVTLLCELHDDGVEPHHGRVSELFRRPSASMIRTEPGSGVVIETVLENLEEQHLSDFSEGFTRELDHMFRYWSRDQETPDRDELDFSGCTDTEKACLHAIAYYGQNSTFPVKFWHTYLRGAYRDVEFDTLDTEIVENEYRPFSEGSYDSQATQYILDEDRLEESHFHLSARTVEEDGEEYAVCGLWLQYTTTGGDKEEIPVVYTSEGHWVLYSEDVEFGDTEYTDNLTSEFKTALVDVVNDNSPKTTDLMLSERVIINTIANTDITGTRTETLLNEVEA